jgi:hypothetical protein
MKPIQNIQEYIDSGILEQFVLGMTTPEQNAEILQYKNNYPEIAEEIALIENALEQFGQAFAKPMPQPVKDKILNEVNKNSIVQTPNASPWKWICILSILVLGGILYTYWKLNHIQKKQIQLLENKIALQDSLKIQDSLALLDCSNQLAFIKGKDVQRIKLNGTEKSPQSIANIYYDKNNHRVILDDIELPQAPTDKQYQLWAIVDNKPVDLGVFDLGNKPIDIEFKFDSLPSAFAITLEARGGVPSPTMDMMYVIGKM